MIRLRWRLNDPAEENRERWTRVHRAIGDMSPKALCGVAIPEHPYMADYNADIPDGAPDCRSCAKKGATNDETT